MDLTTGLTWPLTVIYQWPDKSEPHQTMNVDQGGNPVQLGVAPALCGHTIDSRASDRRCAAAFWTDCSWVISPSYMALKIADTLHVTSHLKRVIVSCVLPTRGLVSSSKLQQPVADPGFS